MASYCCSKIFVILSSCFGFFYSIGAWFLSIYLSSHMPAYLINRPKISCCKKSGKTFTVNVANLFDILCPDFLTFITWFCIFVHVKRNDLLCRWLMSSTGDSLRAQWHFGVCSYCLCHVLDFLVGHCSKLRTCRLMSFFSLASIRSLSSIKLSNAQRIIECQQNIMVIYRSFLLSSYDTFYDLMDWTENQGHFYVVSPPYFFPNNDYLCIIAAPNVPPI